MATLTVTDRRLGQAIHGSKLWIRLSSMAAVGASACHNEEAEVQIKLHLPIGIAVEPTRDLCEP